MIREQTATTSRRSSGLLHGITAYSLWGVFPLYFKLLAHVSPWVVLCHRVLWSALFLAVVVTFRREWNCIWPAIRSRRSVALLSLGAVLIAINWLVFIYAVGRGMVLQSSLGYFINPLLTIFLGTMFLGERLRGLQWTAVAIAGAGVLNLALRGGAFPWIALSLAFSFGFYSLVRKQVNINSLHGLLIESSLLVPIAAIALPLLSFGHPPAWSTFGILSLAGVVTATPMLFFGAALRSLKLSTVGFLQYIGPTGQFLIAILVFGETLEPAKLLSFVLCWIAIAVYVLDSLITSRAAEIERPE